jgi:hypothetical protein
MKNSSEWYLNNRKKEIKEQFNYWKPNLGSGFLRLVERLIFRFNISDMLGGNLEQIQHLDDVKDQIGERKLVQNAKFQSSRTSNVELNNLEASSPQYLFILKRAHVDVLTGIIVLDAGFIVDSTLAKWQKIIYRGGIGSAVKRTFNAKELMLGTHMVLPHSPYFFHIVLDELPNLIRIRDSHPECNSVIVSKLMPKWGLELLEYFGFESKVTSKNSLIVENLVSITAPRILIKENLLLLRRNIEHTQEKIIIVSRSGNPRDDEMLEFELLQAIPEAQLVNPGNLSVEKQIEVFSGAKIIIGLHGGGLSNVIWMHHSGKLIELFNHPYRTSDYERLATELGIDYSGIDTVNLTFNEVTSLVKQSINEK